ncbi:hypothetical protein HK098_006620, partial [Nowakowskiella sp. JEL0407]
MNDKASYSSVARSQAARSSNSVVKKPSPPPTASPALLIDDFPELNESNTSISSKPGKKKKKKKKKKNTSVEVKISDTNKRRQDDVVDEISDLSDDLSSATNISLLPGPNLDVSKIKLARDFKSFANVEKDENVAKTADKKSSLLSTLPIIPGNQYISKIKLAKDFKSFANVEKEQFLLRKKFLMKRERNVIFEELKSFSQNFKLNSPVPKDLYRPRDMDNDDRSVHNTTESSAGQQSKRDSEINNLGRGNDEQSDALRILKRGKLPVQRIKVILLGKGEAGKTSLIKALRGETFNEMTERTNYVDLMEVEQHELDNWEELNDVSQISRSFKVAKIREKAIVEDSGARDMTERFSDSNSDIETVTESDDTLEDKYSAYINLLTQDVASFQGETVTLSVYDFAGQDVYSSLQQIFVTSNAIYVVAFNIKKMFTDENATPNQSELQVVLSWLATIHLRAPDAKILLVATQVDGTVFENEILSDSSVEMLRDLEDRLPESILEQLIEVDDQPNDFVLITSAKTGFQISNLKMSINEAVQESISAAEEIQLGWIQFQDELAKGIRQKSCRMVYSIDEMFKEWIQTNPQFDIYTLVELKEVLKYFHTIGVVLYYHENEDLAQFVFTDPQRLVNVLCRIFKLSYEPLQLKDVDKSNRKWARKVRSKNGYWTKSLLCEVLKKMGVIESQHHLFTSLLKEFNLYCEIRSGNSNEADIILPCLLSDEDIGLELPRNYYRAGYQVIDLILSFPQSTLPKGLFHQLAIQFAAKSAPGYKPILNLHSSLLSIGDTRQIIIKEEVVYGVISIRLFLKSDIRVEFNYSWMIINSTIELVLLDHWSRRTTSLDYNLTVKCPAAGTGPQPGDELPHGIASIPEFGSTYSDHPVFCEHA